MLTPGRQKEGSLLPNIHFHFESVKEESCFKIMSMLVCNMCNVSVYDGIHNDMGNIFCRLMV